VEKEATNAEVLNLHDYTHAGLWHELGGEEPSPYRDLIVAYIKKWSLK
jgi:hypothetical protein